MCPTLDDGKVLRQPFRRALKLRRVEQDDDMVKAVAGDGADRRRAICHVRFLFLQQRLLLNVQSLRNACGLLATEAEENTLEKSGVTRYLDVGWRRSMTKTLPYGISQSDV
jgi:hypothetical protein